MKTSTLVMLAAAGLGLYWLTRRGNGSHIMDPDLWAVSLWGQSGLSEQSTWYLQHFLSQGYEPEAASRAAQVAEVADRINEQTGWNSGGLRSL